MTTFPDMLYQLGGSPVNGMMTNGKALFVRPYDGSDQNTGRGVITQKAVKTTKKALSLATEYGNDVVYLVSRGSVLADTEDAITSTVLWNKDATHLIGIGSGNHMFQRSTIRPTATATAASVAPVMTISASNCRFENISIMNDRDSASALGACKITGSRNHFKSCHFAGNVGGTGTSDAAGQYDLWLNGAQENLFEDCVIGTDTITRTSQTYSMYFSAASGAGVARNVFRRCVFPVYAGANTMTWLTTPASSMDRWNLFEDCTFINCIGSAATTMTQGFAITNSGSPNGLVLLKNCLMIGATYDESTASNGLYYDSTATTKGIVTRL